MSGRDKCLQQRESLASAVAELQSSRWLMPQARFAQFCLAAISQISTASFAALLGRQRCALLPYFDRWDWRLVSRSVARIELACLVPLAFISGGILDLFSCKGLTSAAFLASSAASFLNLTTSSPSLEPPMGRPLPDETRDHHRIRIVHLIHASTARDLPVIWSKKTKFSRINLLRRPLRSRRLILPGCNDFFSNRQQLVAGVWMKPHQAKKARYFHSCSFAYQIAGSPERRSKKVGSDMSMRFGRSPLRIPSSVPAFQTEKGLH